MTLIKGRPRFVRALPMLFVSHHALSRAAQRAGVRTPADIIRVAGAIWDAVLDQCAAGGDDLEAYLKTPPRGRRVRVDADLTVILQSHRTRLGLVAVTAMESERCRLESEKIGAVDDRQD